MKQVFTVNVVSHNEYDVVVAGGGPAGVAAATAAARDGAKTLLIEASSMLGGMATRGLVTGWCPFTDGVQIIYGGIAQKVLLQNMAAMPHWDQKQYDWVPIDVETLKLAYDEMVSNAGADILFNSSVCAVEMADKRHIDSVIVANKAGLTAYKAKIFIDCTGDADLAAWAGNEMAAGAESGDFQPATHCFLLSNVNTDALYAQGDQNGGSSTSVIHKIVADAEFDIKDSHFCFDVIGPKTMGFNAGHIWNVDATDPEKMSAGILKGRQMARELLTALKKYRPDIFADAYLAETAPALGTRESRRIVGDYCFTLNDYLERKTFPDEIGHNCYFIDIHKSLDDLETMQIHSDMRYEHYKPGESHGIPYRCLVPKDIDNLLVAGRTISSDRITQGSLRVMPCCLVEGEAAGAAAAFCVEMNNDNVHQVDTQLLRKRLMDYGAYLPKLETDTF